MSKTKEAQELRKRGGKSPGTEGAAANKNNASSKTSRKSGSKSNTTADATDGDPSSASPTSRRFFVALVALVCGPLICWRAGLIDIPGFKSAKSTATGSGAPADSSSEESKKKLAKKIRKLGVKENSVAASIVRDNGKQVAFPKPPDVRPPKCASKESKYDTGNSTVSIVIPYLRETWEHIKGTVGSLFANTPDELLHEILFISDGNTDAEAHEEAIIGLNPPSRPNLIKVHRLPERTGLIYAKMLGAQMATGDIVMMFEPHCIVNKFWLEPLVHIVNNKPNSLALPVLDYIPQHNFREYSRAALGRYRFEWNFNLIYTNPPSPLDHNRDLPFFAPATSGGIFAIRKSRFIELNLFDVGMKQWGGDQIELSFKAWRCGGSILVVPCSRVGHLFRDPAHRPYPVDVPQVVENYAKLARVWLEEPYLSSFWKVKPEGRSMALDADLSVPRETMKRLQCESMDWYVKNVDLELGWESYKICIPGAHGHPHGCAGPAAPGRSTIDREISPGEYAQWASKSKFFSDEAWEREFTDAKVF